MSKAFIFSAMVLSVVGGVARADVVMPSKMEMTCSQNPKTGKGLVVQVVRNIGSNELTGSVYLNNRPTAIRNEKVVLTVEENPGTPYEKPRNYRSRNISMNIYMMALPIREGRNERPGRIYANLDENRRSSDATCVFFR